MSSKIHETFIFGVLYSNDKKTISKVMYILFINPIDFISVYLLNSVFIYLISTTSLNIPEISCGVCILFSNKINLEIASFTRNFHFLDFFSDHLQL